jgi:type II secretion system (T2SS) protein M
MTLQLGMSARDRRTLVVGGVTIGLLVGVARGLPALLAWQRDRVADALTLTTQARAARAEVKWLPSRRDTLRSRKARLAEFDSVMLSGVSSSAAAAQLASALGDIADEAPLKVSAMQLRADSAHAGTIASVAVRVTGTTDVAGLAGFLRAVEAGRTPLLVREIAVTQPDPLAPDNKIENLRVDILVEGLARILVARPERR